MLLSAVMWQCLAQGTVGCTLCLLPFSWIIWTRHR